MKNPYTLVFGKEPKQLISRISQISEIAETFNSEIPSQQIYMITGVRGTGKTVVMTEIAKKLNKKGDWIVAELNPEKDMLLGLAAKLSSENELARIFKAAKINLSFFGFGLEVTGQTPITDIETAITKMMESLRKHGKRVLITVDEVTSTQTMREFASAFQIFVRQDLPIFLLMTGLYENVNKLQNEKNLTFLYRAPKIELKPLNIGAIAKNYKGKFKLDDDTALHMAKLTRGYSFAFQVLGYFTWENDGDYDGILSDYKQYLDDYVYDKIWSELSRGDKRILYGMAKCENGKISSIREILGIETNEFNPYRKRLIKKGIVNGDERGYVKFVLPLFEQYVLENYDE
ncbi:MAG: ATP-binding protein [Lachnospiraceae bacterium]|nr:ATP-binding protein [Lachnospiraceae bacterium]